MPLVLLLSVLAEGDGAAEAVKPGAPARLKGAVGRGRLMERALVLTLYRVLDRMISGGIVPVCVCVCVCREYRVDTMVCSGE